MIEDRHIESFDADLSGRENSGRYNDLREEALVWMINAPSGALDAAKSKLTRPYRLDLVNEALRDALDALALAEGIEVRSGLWRAQKRGGRRNKFDFDFEHSDANEGQKVSVELKRGESIYDQPQFWQVYTNYTGLLKDGVPTYAEFFFDHFLNDLTSKFEVSAGSRQNYLKSVYRTTDDSEPFTTLRQVALQGGAGASLLKEFHYISVDKYISFLLTLPNAGLEFEAFQERLYLQLPKRFLSWDSLAERFLWERLDRESLTLTGEIQARGKRSGQLHTLVLGTVTGQQLHLLLRWKNRSCVLGPAWQIKLTPENAA